MIQEKRKEKERPRLGADQEQAQAKRQLLQSFRKRPFAEAGGPGAEQKAKMKIAALPAGC